MCQVKTYISLGIRPESSLSTWWMLESLATHCVHSEDSDQTGQMPRLIWVFDGRTCDFVILSCGQPILDLNNFMFLDNFPHKAHQWAAPHQLSAGIHNSGVTWMTNFLTQFEQNSVSQDNWLVEIQNMTGYISKALNHAHTFISRNIWAASWENQQNSMCDQRKLRSAWATEQISFYCALSG